ncbi:MAG: RNA-binding S4 domain-containing protein [Nocardioidaceae bacterium]
MTAETPIEITGDIRLGQFLKRADLVDQGSDVKQLLATESVIVNDVVEQRRGRQLTTGDRVRVAQTTYVITEDRTRITERTAGLTLYSCTIN